MNQFKDVFLGQSFRDYTKAASSQKCVRVGGKHNDLENVGHTSRHLTFFEMLGNFSFGDYFKKEAIAFAWEVSVDVFGLDPDRIWPSVFQEDDEAFELWKKYVPEKRITRFGEKENFWAMGETGPCGPCSELLYDRGEHFGSGRTPIEDPSGERFLEYWNLVFMQYNRSKEGVMTPLPKPSIDTGAGLERIISLKMGVESVFETDILKGIINKTAAISKVAYKSENAPAFHVIADHLRSLAFAIADGAQPSNLDRGYVLRKVLRRAVRYGRQLGFEEPFLAKVLPELVLMMGSDYPELVQGQSRIAEILTLEEESFLRTLKRGGNLLNQIMERAKGHHGEISGDDAFKLKDTYGLPFEEITLLAKDGGLSVDESRYQQLEKEAKERSRAVQKNADQMASTNLFASFNPTQFLGYATTESSGLIQALVKEGQLVEMLLEGEEGMVIVDQTPFYAEMGGQVGDTGTLSASGVLFAVTDCIAPFKGIIAHEGKVEQGKLQVGDQIKLSVDATRRQQIANNHTATHLLHFALHQVLGTHIKQAGSVVDAERLRFDFSHHKPLTKEEIASIEDLVNVKIRENHPVKTYELPYEEVKEKGNIKQFFGEKYGAQVRVVETDEAKELCGGTHTSASGTIGYFRIEKESSIAAGVRRIEAVTGKRAEDLAKKSEEQLAKLALLLKINESKIQERVEKLLEENKAYARSLKAMRQSQVQEIKKEALESQRTIRDTALIAFEGDLEPDELRIIAEEMIKELKSGMVLLGSSRNQKAQLYLRLTDDLVKKGLMADAIMRDLARLIEGSGGGKPQGAMAGGKAYEKIPLALIKIADYIP